MLFGTGGAPRCPTRRAWGLRSDDDAHDRALPPGVRLVGGHSVPEDHGRSQPTADIGPRAVARHRDPTPDLRAVLPGLTAMRAHCCSTQHSLPRPNCVACIAPVRMYPFHTLMELPAHCRNEHCGNSHASSTIIMGWVSDIPCRRGTAVRTRAGGVDVICPTAATTWYHERTDCIQRVTSTNHQCPIY